MSSTMKRAAQTIRGLAEEACCDDSRGPALAPVRWWAYFDSTVSASPVLAPATPPANPRLAAIPKTRSTTSASFQPFPQATRLLYLAESGKV